MLECKIENIWAIPYGPGYSLQVLVPSGFLLLSLMGLLFKYNAPHETDAQIMRWVFAELAEGLINTEQVLKQARKKGFAAVRIIFGSLSATRCIAVKFLSRNIKMMMRVLFVGSMSRW